MVAVSSMVFFFQKYTLAQQWATEKLTSIFFGSLFKPGIKTFV